MPEYKPSEKKLLWPNGAITSFFYGSEPELSRGAQSDLIWFDELFKFQYPKDTVDNLFLGLRLEKNPVALITSTPKPLPLCRELEQKKNTDGSPAAVVTIGTTLENKRNLSPVFIDNIISKYQGSRLGLQELQAMILDDNPGALFKREILERDTVSAPPPPGKIRRVIIAVDPAASNNEMSNHTGIIAVFEGGAPDTLISGQTVQYQNKKHFYIVEDASIIGLPHQWGAKTKIMAEKYGAGTVLYESNQGGDMVKAVLQTAGVQANIVPVRAVADKEKRAMNPSLISNQGRLHIVKGNDLEVLKSELCNWVPGSDSPDRMDALVHAINYLEGSGEGGGVGFAPVIGV
jgi:phage terminase large subunit-like protein